MKKENNFTAVVVVNMVLLALVALNKTYKPLLDKLAKQYNKLKNENKMTKEKQINDYKMATSKIFEEAKSKLGNLEDLVNEAFTTYSIQDTKDCEGLSKEVQKYLVRKIGGLEDSSLMNSEESVLAVAGVGSVIIDSNVDEINLGPVETGSNCPMHASFIKKFCGTIALIVAFNTWGISDTKSIAPSLDTFIIRDLDDLFNNIKEEMLAHKENSTFIMERKEEITLIPQITNEDKWNRILELEQSSFDSAIDTIVNSGASEVEILQFIVKTDKLTLEQKVWYAMLLSDVPFPDVFQSLLSIEGVTQDQIVMDIIKCDMVSFERLFDVVLQLDGLTKEQLMNYLSFYHADYNAMTLTDTVNYVLGLEIFTYEEKLNCIWHLLDKYSLNDKIQFILDFYQITYEDYLNLYSVNKEEFSKNQHIIFDLFENVNKEKEQYILTHYDFASQEQLDIVVAGCAAEGANAYDDLYGVANTIFNRTTKSSFVTKYGANPYLQFIAPNQFEVYGLGSYKYYLSGNSQYATKYARARQAFYDMFYRGYEGIEHSYTAFRSNATINFSNNLIVPNGNRYGSPMDESMRIDYKNIRINELDGKQPKRKI